MGDTKKIPAKKQKEKNFIKDSHAKTMNTNSMQKDTICMGNMANIVTFNLFNCFSCFLPYSS